MADTAVAITAGTGTNIDTRTEATNGNHRQVIVIGDPATNAGVAPVDVSLGLSVNVTNPAIGAVADAAWVSGNGTNISLLKNLAASASRLISSATSIAAGSALATTSFLTGGRYDSTQKTLTNGQEASHAMSARGALIVNPGVEPFSVVNSSGEYETVAASATNQAIGAPGATGDYLAGVLIVPASTSPGAVTIKDGAGGAITIFAGGATSVSNLVPFYVPLGYVSTAGAWQITTGANVSALAHGNFT
jgi:hypothetical protein